MPCLAVSPSGELLNVEHAPFLLPLVASRQCLKGESFTALLAFFPLRELPCARHPGFMHQSESPCGMERGKALPHDPQFFLKGNCQVQNTLLSCTARSFQMACKRGRPCSVPGSSPSWGNYLAKNARGWWARVVNVFGGGG